MTDDLVKRLRDPAFGTETSERNLMASAADRIEQLTAERDRLREALDRISRFTHISPWGHETQSYEVNIARAALKGETP